jgi:hypothetical protein
MSPLTGKPDKKRYEVRAVFRQETRGVLKLFGMRGLIGEAMNRLVELLHESLCGGRAAICDGAVMDLETSSLRESDWWLNRRFHGPQGRFTGAILARKRPVLGPGFRTRSILQQPVGTALIIQDTLGRDIRQIARLEMGVMHLVHLLTHHDAIGIALLRGKLTQLAIAHRDLGVLILERGIHLEAQEFIKPLG